MSNGGIDPRPVGGKSCLKDAGSGKKRAGHYLADIAKVETQALVQSASTGVGLRPGGKLPKLLLDNRSGPIFHGATHNTAASPILRGKSKPRLHRKSPIVRIEPGTTLHSHYLPHVRLVNI